MKKLFISMLAVAALASCSNEQTLELNPGEDISFGGPFVENSTRAAVDPSYGAADNAQKLTEFNVWGTVSGGNVLVAIFNNTPVKGTTGENSVWNTQGVTQYWIKDAIYNFAALVNAADKVALDDETKLPKEVVNFAADGATDLLYAKSDADILGKASGNDEVAFTFDHLLSKVKFTVINGSQSATGYSFKVNNIVVNGNSVGTCEVPAKTWKNLGTPKVYNVEEIAVDNTTASQECAQELLLIPGEYDITFSVDIYNGGVKLGTQAYPVDGTTYKQTLAVGNAYNFQINVAVGEEITFTVEKEPTWTVNTGTSLN